MEKPTNKETHESKPAEKTAEPVHVTSTAQGSTTASVEPKKTSGLAIAALILAFIFPIIGLILGIVALSSIKKNNEGGKGFAIASIVISLVIMLSAIFGTILFLTAFNSALKTSGVDVNTSTGSINVTGKDGESASFGNTKLPDGFPSDVPVYEPSDVILSLKSKDTFNVTLATSDDSSKVVSFYKTQLASKGWNKEDTEINFGTGSASTFTKGNQQLIVLIGTDRNSNTEKKTTVNLTVGTKTSN